MANFGSFSDIVSAFSDCFTTIITLFAAGYAIREYRLHKKEVEANLKDQKREDKVIESQIWDYYMAEIAKYQRVAMESVASMWGMCILFSGVPDYSAQNTDPENKIMKDLSDNDRLNQIREYNKIITDLQNKIENVRMCRKIIEGCLSKIKGINIYLINKDDNLFLRYYMHMREYECSCFVAYCVFTNNDFIIKDNRDYYSNEMFEKWRTCLIGQSDESCVEDMEKRGKKVLAETKGEERHALNWSDFLRLDIEKDLINDLYDIHRFMIENKLQYLNS